MSLAGCASEARALQDRKSYLGMLAVQRHCGGAQQPRAGTTPLNLGDPRTSCVLLLEGVQ
jgi:hypothetical protein